MHMTRGWTGLRTAVIALGIIAGTTTGAKADALLQYSTAGSVDTSSGVTGANVISYVPLNNVTVDGTSYLPMGSFQVAALPAGQSTTYNNTPFSLTFVPETYNGIALTDASPLTVTGTLTGIESGPYQSSVVATFNMPTSGSLELAGASSTLAMQDSQEFLVPSAAGGTTTIQGALVTLNEAHEVPAPEPSTIAIFLSAVGGIGLRRFVLSRRQRKLA